MRTIRFLLALLALAIPATTFAQVRVSIAIGPPALPVYEQPVCPGDGYLWTPGYWAYDDSISDYYWAPGTWVLAPEAGFLWTPGYWGWGDGGYIWYDGYWGPTVGFYGGIDYGFGYFGVGFGGGHWVNDHFFYNTFVSNVDVTVIHNVYKTTLIDRNTTRVSYNGGRGGVTARPTPEEEAAGHERHVGPVAAQQYHASAARSNPQLRASANHGNPPIAATSRPGEFNGHPAGTGGAEEPARRGAAESAAEPRNAVHPKDLSPIAHTEPNTGDPKQDKKLQKQQDKMIAKQQQERDQLQQKQDAEHQKKMNSEKSQKLEQKHAQQTQNLAQKHTAQQQSFQARMPQPRAQEAPRR